MMARLPAMVTALARIDGRDRGTVDNLIRYIRERGYIPTVKRGQGAAEMTTREVVNGLLALNGADSPKDAPNAIDRFRSLRQWAVLGKGTEGSAQLERYESLPKALQAVMDGGTFGDALEGLIDELPSLISSLRQFTAQSYTQFDDEQVTRAFPSFLNMHVLGVDIILQRYAATIEVYSSGFDRQVQFSAKFMKDMDRLEDGFYGRAAETDRRVQVTIGTPTLIAAWQVLHPHERMPELPPPTQSDDATEEDET